jgi:hypothetical protein
MLVKTYISPLCGVQFKAQTINWSTVELSGLSGEELRKGISHWDRQKQRERERYKVAKEKFK